MGLALGSSELEQPPGLGFVRGRSLAVQEELAEHHLRVGVAWSGVGLA